MYFKLRKGETLKTKMRPRSLQTKSPLTPREGSTRGLKNRGCDFLTEAESLTRRERLKVL
ncbi:hypothetical protein LEP1GSC050_1802 [Leptospira broomii serovar Hurstbridge str. 5399]|uniref:Uncharacterized protein n=1 Tax=Leptospira broomii serovar Hurstbridge str. 5399 TaxID=1049789 RepID=T0GPT4_9LEPT|nr:hypothetical protein LEP1GSC050_1802 [Leptospira broomii serovar Hurstbridge str. 5399]